MQDQDKGAAAAGSNAGAKRCSGGSLNKPAKETFGPHAGGVGASRPMPRSRQKGLAAESCAARRRHADPQQAGCWPSNGEATALEAERLEAERRAAEAGGKARAEAKAAEAARLEISGAS